MNDSIRSFFYLLNIFIVILITPVIARAQLAPGGDGYVFPPGGKAGTTIKVQMGGGDWTPDTQFFVHDAGIKLDILTKPGPVLMPLPPYFFGIKSFLNDPRLPREVSAQFTIPENHPPGPIYWSVANANGAGTGGVFIVGTGNEILEEEDSKVPQLLPSLPVTVNGRLGKIEEMDRYQFRATQSSLVTCELFARRLGSDFLGVLEARDLQGQLIADVISTAGKDPVLTFAVEKGKDYVVAVRDIDHAGYRCYSYRLEFRIGSRILATIPAVGVRGKQQAFDLVGIGLKSGKPQLEQLTKIVSIPADSSRKTFDLQVDSLLGQDKPYSLELADSEDQIRLAKSKQDLKFMIPTAVTGRFEIGEPKVHSFRFESKKGKLINLRIHQPLLQIIEVEVKLAGPDGKVILPQMGVGSSNELNMEYTLPLDGEYRIDVNHISDKKATHLAVYRLVLRESISDFELKAIGPVNIPIGGKGTIPIQVVRKGGFQEPITLTAEGLPDGLTLPKDAIIPAKVNTYNLNLECKSNAAAVAALVEFVGTAKEGDKKYRRLLHFRLRGDLVEPDSRANYSSKAMVATTMKVPFKVKAAEADGGRRIPRGSTHLAPILIDRTNGFQGEIVLDMAANQQRHRQGIRGPALVVPPGMKTIDYPVFLPECLETSKTSRIGLVAMGKVADPTGKPHDLLTPVEGQITLSIEGALMKLSHSDEEIVVKPGNSFQVPLKLYRVSHLVEPVTIELILPSNLKDQIKSKPMIWPGTADQAFFQIQSLENSRMKGFYPITIQAKTLRNGYPVVSETIVEIEFTGSSEIKPLSIP